MPERMILVSWEKATARAAAKVRCRTERPDWFMANVGRGMGLGEREKWGRGGPWAKATAGAVVVKNGEARRKD